MCVFCNQRSISGVCEFNSDSVIPIIEEALGTVAEDCEAEIAFFGGSFTGIDRDLMIRLLEIAYSYVKSGRVSSIRCSTRPDYINPEILDILEKYKVKVIELGLQSTDKNVLLLTKRNHTFEEEKIACELIVKRGFQLVGQMMIGLPGSNLESEEKTADFIISSGALGARIYPTVVFRDTELCNMSISGEYTPITLDEAITRSARVMQKFINAGVKVIRVGLCSSENLRSEETYYMGPNHPALGELVENEVYYNLINEKLSLSHSDNYDKITVNVAKGMLSKAIGQKKKNKVRLMERYKLKEIVFSENSNLSDYEICLKTEKGNKDVFKVT